MPDANTVSDQILNSWKEIARYLNRGVRTVQRWEAELGLPVRRPRGRRRSAVIAMRSEIDQWLSHCPLEALEAEEPAGSAPEVKPPARTQQPEEELPLSELIISSRLLRKDLQRSQKELQEMVQTLRDSIAAYRLLIQELPHHMGTESIKVLKIDTSRVA